MDELQETYNSKSEVQHVAEELALESVISEERHGEILEETDRVCNRLDQLSTEAKMESQSLREAIAAEVRALKAELIALKAELVSMKESAASRPSPQVTPLPEPNPPAPSEGDGRPVVVTVQPEVPPLPAPPSPTPKRRKI